MQQQFARLDDRLGVKTLAHLALMKRVGDGDDGHALMVRHVVADQDMIGVFGQPRSREVDRLVKSVAPEETVLRKRRAVLGGRARVDHRGQGGRVRGDHGLAPETALHRQIRHAERLVLVVLLQVSGVEGRFRDAPGDRELSRVAALAGDDRPIALMHEAVDGVAHHQAGHQIFEHRAGPRKQRDAAVDFDQPPPQARPQHRMHVALGDGEHAGHPRFGREQVVAAAVKPVVGDVESDRKQVAPGIQQEVELHGVRHLARPCAPAPPASPSSRRDPQTRRPGARRPSAKTPAASRAVPPAPCRGRLRRTGRSKRRRAGLAGKCWPASTAGRPPRRDAPKSRPERSGRAVRIADRMRLGRSKRRAPARACREGHS